jgi:hypothetical protein
MCNGSQLNDKVNISMIVFNINLPTCQRTIIIFTIRIQPLAWTLSIFVYNIPWIKMSVLFPRRKRNRIKLFFVAFCYRVYLWAKKISLLRHQMYYPWFTLSLSLLYLYYLKRRNVFPLLPLLSSSFWSFAILPIVEHSFSARAQLGWPSYLVTWTAPETLPPAKLVILPLPSRTSCIYGAFRLTLAELILKRANKFLVLEHSAMCSQCRVCVESVSSLYGMYSHKDADNM